MATKSAIQEVRDELVSSRPGLSKRVYRAIYVKPGKSVSITLRNFTGSCEEGFTLVEVGGGGSRVEVDTENFDLRTNLGVDFDNRYARLEAALNYDPPEIEKARRLFLGILEDRPGIRTRLPKTQEFLGLHPGGG